MKLSLRTKIIAWSFVPTAILLLLVALAMYVAYQQVTENFALQRDVELTRLSASQLSAGFEDYIDRLWTLSRLRDVQDGDPQKQQAALTRSKNRLVLFDAGVYLLDTQGVVVASQPEKAEWTGQDWSRRSYFWQLIRSTKPFFSDILPDGPQGQDVIVLSVPVLGENDEFKGVVAGMFRLDVYEVSPFFGTILKLNAGRSGAAYIVDGNGRMLYDSNFKLIGQNFGAHPVAQPALEGQLGAVRTRATDGREVVSSYAPVPRTSWALVIDENWADIVRPIQGYGRFLAGLLVLGVIVPTVVVFGGVRRITGPVNHFIAAARRLAAGDFNQSIEVHTGDELEMLAAQFNHMAAELRSSYDELECRVAERTRELTALNEIAAAVSQSLDLQRILPQALGKTIELMGADSGLVYRLDEAAGTLHLVAGQGLSENLSLLIRQYPLSASIVQAVVQTRQLAVRRVEDYPPGPVRDELERMGVKRVTSIPLLVQEKVLGAINLHSLAGSEPKPESLAVARAVGQQIGVAMDNTRLFAQTVDYARNMEIARAAAEEANASKSVFLANVSHELRTPLTSILGFTRIVQKRLEERILPQTRLDDRQTERAVGQVRDNLGIILSEGQRLTNLINDVLDLEKIEAGKMTWNMQPVAIGDIIQRAATATLALFEQKGLELNFEVAENLPRVNGDPDRLVQVLVNLLSNAAKFTAQGKVACWAHCCEQDILVSVIDQGVGIAARDHTAVFEKFKQVGESLTGKPTGTGLGLAICKEIVEYHGGRIWVESEPGQGSIFTFSLPTITSLPQVDEGVRVITLDALLAELETGDPPGPAGQGNPVKRLLVVDDDAPIRSMLRQELEAAGYRVYEAADGRQALAEARRLHPDLVILDVMMPELNGFDVAAVLKNDPLTYGLPILILSILEDRGRGFHIGVDCYLTKPIDMPALLSEVERLLSKGPLGKNALLIGNGAKMQSAQAALQSQGYQARLAASRAAGQEQAARERPDMVVIDAALPGARDLLDALRAERGSDKAFYLLLSD